MTKTILRSRADTIAFSEARKVYSDKVRVILLDSTMTIHDTYMVEIEDTVPATVVNIVAATLLKGTNGNNYILVFPHEDTRKDTKPFADEVSDRVENILNQVLYSRIDTITL